MDALQIIGERRIREAVERGELDDLPHEGQPLVLEDLRGNVWQAENRRLVRRFVERACTGLDGGLLRPDRVDHMMSWDHGKLGGIY